MFEGVTDFTSKQQGDSAEFMRKVQALLVGRCSRLPAGTAVCRSNRQLVWTEMDALCGKDLRRKTLLRWHS